jgi:hypothetical protein
MHAHACQFVASARLVEDLLQRRDLPGAILAYVHFACALALLFAGRLVEAADLFDQAIADHGRAADSPWFYPIAMVWKCQALLLAGRFFAAGNVAEASYQQGLNAESTMMVGMACLSRGQVSRATGQLQQAARWFREGLAGLREDRGFVSQLLGELAHTIALLGDQPAAHAALAESISTRRHNFLVYHIWIDLAGIWVTAAAGDLAAAANEAVRIATVMRESSAPAYEAIALHEAARLGCARLVADRLRELERDIDNRLVVLC